MSLSPTLSILSHVFHPSLPRPYRVNRVQVKRNVRRSLRELRSRRARFLRLRRLVRSRAGFRRRRRRRRRQRSDRSPRNSQYRRDLADVRDYRASAHTPANRCVRIDRVRDACHSYRYLSVIKVRPIHDLVQGEGATRACPYERQERSAQGRSCECGCNGGRRRAAGEGRDDQISQSLRRAFRHCTPRVFLAGDS